jgi:2-oxoglutarate ferredoxin oxidoreductase subunit beta
LHDISYIAPRSEIILEEEMKEGEVREVTMHDGSIIILKNLEQDYNPTDRFEAIRVLAEAQANNWLATGLIYIETDKPSLTDMHNLVDTPLNRLGEADLRPAPEMIEKVNALMF